ncbi:DUF4825 domain-containing protein [Robertmurraya sp. P23]|uniref:DUF4825 domain-containing protein n=1 Tax=Robertmurraya sp. P23 TaxID=3436931 RepID=UPI003D982B82
MRHKQMIKYFIFSLLIVLFLSGCNSNKTNNDIFNFKGSYVGDNSAVGNIVNQLQGGEHLRGFELKTNEEPYGVILKYQWLDTEQKHKETAIYNSIYLFTLVQNVDWITFIFDSREYTITKEDLQEASGIKFSEIQNDDMLIDLTQKYLEDESSLNQLFE